MALRLTVETTSESIATYVFIFDQPEISVGRSATCHVQLPFPTVSSHHLTLLREGSTYLVADIGSTNGTRLNKKRLEPNHYTSVQVGDRLVLTDVVLHIGATETFDGGMTSEQTSELVRDMVSDYLQSQSLDPNDAQAHLEVLQGVDQGTRYPLDKKSPVSVGSDPEQARWVLGDPSLPPCVLTISHTGMAWLLERSAGHDLPVYLDGFELPQTGQVRLRGGGRIRVADSTLLFVDPLEALLSSLEDISGDEGDSYEGRVRPKPTVEVPREALLKQLQAVSETKAAQKKLTEDTLDPSLGQQSQDFSSEDTKQVHDHEVHHDPPRTRIGLPLSGDIEPGLAEAGSVEDEALSNATARQGWSRTDIVLLALTLVLALVALIVFLVLFDLFPRT